MRGVPFADRGALVAAGAAAALAILADRPVMPAFLPAGDYPAYDVLGPRALALVEPVAHAPWFGAAPLAQSVLVAAAVTGLLWITTRRAGATRLVALVVCAAVLSRPALRVPITLGADVALALACVWAGMLAASSDLPRRRVTTWTAALAALAVGCWPPLIVVMPLVAVAVSTAPTGVLAVSAGAVIGGISGVALWATRAAALSREPVTLLDALSVVTAGPRGDDPFVWPELTAAILPTALVAVGAVAVGARLSFRHRLALATAGVVPLAAMALLPAWRAEVARAVFWTSWPLVGAGVSWLVLRAPAGRAPWVMAVVAVVLVGGGLSATLRVVEGAERRLFGQALGDAMMPLLRAGALTVVSEDTRVDAAVVAWGSRLGLERVRPVPQLVAAAVDSGRMVLAGPAGRRALELWGFRFVERVHLERPVPFGLASIEARLRCLPVAAPWRELPGVEYTGRLGLHLPAGEGRLDVVIIGPPPLVPRVTWADGRPVGRLEPLTMDLPNLPPVLWPGGGRLPDATLIGVRVELPALADLAQSASLALGQRAPQVAVRYSSPANVATVATVCAAPLPRDDAGGDAGVRLSDDGLFVGGWHAAEQAGGIVFRWTARRAVTLLPSSAAGAVTVVLTARPAARPALGPARVTVTVNGWAAGAQEMTGADREYRWLVPEGVWVAGTNELALEVSHTARPSDAGAADTRELGLAVTSLRIVRP